MKNRSTFPGHVLSTLLLVLVAGPLPGLAAPVAREKVAKAVETWVRRATAEARAEAVVERLDPYQENGTTKAYVVHLKDGGYCLAGADSVVLPIYWYCPKGHYDPKNPGCQTILREIANRQNFVQWETSKGGERLRPHKAALAQRASLWDALGSGVLALGGGSQTAPTGNEPLDAQSSLVLPLTSQWHQFPPYSDDCPDLTPDQPENYTVVGCVATATAQVMKYWQWPNSGVGSASDEYDYRGTSGSVSTQLTDDPGIPPQPGLPLGGWGLARGNYYLSWAQGVLMMRGYWDDSVLNAAQNLTPQIQTNAAFQTALQNLYNGLASFRQPLHADFTTPIQWSLMQDSYPDASPVVAANQSESAVAGLCYEVGVAVNMGYGLYGSGSANSQIPNALSTFFRYSPDVVDVAIDPNQIVEEIQWMRPIVMGGGSSSDGHAWVVYGYNKGTSPWQFRMNMGWMDTADGWYSLDSVPGGFTNSQDQVTQIAPASVVGFVGASNSGQGSPSAPYQNIEEAVAKAPDGATLIFKANSLNTFSAQPLVINRPLTLKGYQATITN